MGIWVFGSKTPQGTLLYGACTCGDRQLLGLSAIYDKFGPSFNSVPILAKKNSTPVVSVAAACASPAERPVCGHTCYLGPFDLVLMDVHMPGMDGIEATIAIREKEKFSGLHQPVIAMTALAMKGDRERCVAAGMDGYLSKPIDLQQLDEVLAVYADRRCRDVDVTAAHDPLLAAVNTTELLQRIDADRAFLAELVGTFREEYPAMILDAQGAISRRDAAGVERVGHALKGALGNLAASGASSLAGEMETMGRIGNLALAQAKLTETEHEVHCVLETLDALLLESAW